MVYSEQVIAFVLYDETIGIVCYADWGVHRMTVFGRVLKVSAMIPPEGAGSAGAVSSAKESWKCFLTAHKNYQECICIASYASLTYLFIMSGIRAEAVLKKTDRKYKNNTPEYFHPVELNEYIY